MKENAYYVTDETKVEQASAGLNATARDMARFGQLLLNNGNITENKFSLLLLLKI